MNNILVSIISPVYKAEKIVSELVRQIIENISLITDNFEIILVEDGSPDNSWLEIESECQKDRRIKGIKLSRNFGQHAAISAGLKYAFGEKIIIMDCDLQDNPEDIPKLWKKSQEGYDIVMARRTQRKENLWRRFLSWSFHQILSLMIGKRTDPAIANYTIYDCKVIKEYHANHRNRIFSVLNLKGVYTFVTIDVIQSISKRGKSGYTLSKLFSVAFSLLFPSKKDSKGPLYIIQTTTNIALEEYDVRLVPLTGEKIEMVRQWRNDPKISQHMRYREDIAPEMQQKWFACINNPDNYYFIIESERKEIGLINIKNIDYNKKSGETGFFIYDDNYINSDVSFRSSLCLGDFISDILKIESAYIHILRNNKKAIEYNKMLGYVLQPEQDNIESQLYYISKENYYKQREYISRLIED